MHPQRIKQLWKMIEPILEPEDLELLEIEYRPQGGRSILRLYIDGPHGVTLDDCVLVSRQVGALLDMEDPIDHPYTLEVSSPGINRVLRREKDFRHFVGSPVAVKTRTKLNGKRTFLGTLSDVKESKIIVDVDGDLVEIELEEVDRARLNLPPEELFGPKETRRCR